MKNIDIEKIKNELQELRMFLNYYELQAIKNPYTSYGYEMEKARIETTGRIVILKNILNGEYYNSAECLTPIKKKLVRRINK